MGLGLRGSTQVAGAGEASGLVAMVQVACGLTRLALLLLRSSLRLVAFEPLLVIFVALRFPSAIRPAFGCCLV
jgi:hypothetical protein